MGMSILRKAVAALAIAGAWFVAPVHAETWPGSEQVTIIVPYPPGTEPDILARDLGFHLNEATGKVFVIENRPGANAIIGTTAVTRAAGDGNTLLMVDRLSLVTNPLLYKSLSYDWRKDLKPVTNVGGVSLFLALKKDSPANTFAEFIDMARKAPGEVNIGTGGKGHVTHLGMEALAQAEGVSFTYVPYKGVAPAMNALLAGETDGMLAGGLVVSQQAKAGKIKVVAIGADKRSDFLPDVPTLKEAGGKPGSIPSTAFTLVVPGATPDTVVAQINAAVAKVMEVPALRNAYEARGLTVNVTSPQETQAQMNQEAERYQKLVDKLGLKPE
jgi:tripartite-type tricarboxylate transporter receptor subunit TctC